MADYQLRLWNAWHHHMALVMMAMLFMLSEKLRMQEQCPLLTQVSLLGANFANFSGSWAREAA
jgi:hypothetical protein